MHVTGAAESGDQRELLLAIRDRLAPIMDDPNTSARDLNAVTYRMLEVLHLLKEIPPPPQAPRRRPGGFGSTERLRL
jgi:hypothetical protein